MAEEKAKKKKESNKQVLNELNGRVEDLKTTILRRWLPHEVVKVINAWFSYFDQNLLGLNNLPIKLDLYSAFDIMSKRGTLIPPFDVSPFVMKTKMGLMGLTKFSREFNVVQFEDSVEEYIHQREKKKEAERLKAEKEKKKRETKTTVANKKVVEEDGERRTTVSTTLEVISLEPDEDEEEPIESSDEEQQVSKPRRPETARQAPKRQKSSMQNDAVTAQYLKKARLTEIKELETEIDLKGKKLPQEEKEKVNNWIKSLNDKLKREAEYVDRIIALKALRDAFGPRKLLPPFDEVPDRGKLKVREFLTMLKEQPVPEPQEAPVRRRVTRPTDDLQDEEEPIEMQEIPDEEQQVPKPRRPQTARQAPKRQKSSMQSDALTAQYLKKARLTEIKELETEIDLKGKKLPQEEQEKVDNWIKSLNDKLKRETEYGDRIIALKALRNAFGPRKLLPPFDEVPARGKLKVREFLTMLKEQPVQEPPPTEAPVRRRVPRPADDEQDEEQQVQRPRRPERATRPAPRRQKSKVDIVAAQYLKKLRTKEMKELEAEIEGKSKRTLSPEGQEKVTAWIRTLNDKLKREAELGDRIIALKALLETLGTRTFLPPFDVLPPRGKLNVREFLAKIKGDTEPEQTMPERAPREAPVRRTRPRRVVPPVEDLQDEEEPIELQEISDEEVPRKTVFEMEFDDEDIDQLTLSNLEDSMYELQDSEREQVEGELIPKTLAVNPPKRHIDKTNQPEMPIELIYDPRDFAYDSPEFSFIPLEIKAYIRLIVRRELIHWPLFLQRLGCRFPWPEHMLAAAELMNV